eukprot:scaffold405_cov243-Pinguiococcus_pyrenoidosus.AAC.1
MSTRRPSLSGKIKRPLCAKLQLVVRTTNEAIIPVVPPLVDHLIGSDPQVSKNSAFGVAKRANKVLNHILVDLDLERSEGADPSVDVLAVGLWHQAWTASLPWTRDLPDGIRALGFRPTCTSLRPVDRSGSLDTLHCRSHSIVAHSNAVRLLYLRNGSVGVVALLVP